MSGRPLSGATYNGFDKGEVYNALTKALIMKKFEEICYYTAELACTKNELPHLLGHLLDIFSKYTNFDNIQLLRRINVLMKEMSALPKKMVLSNNVFQQLLCEFSLLISMHKRTQPLDLVLKESGCNYTIIEHYVYKYNTRDYDFIRDAFKPYSCSNNELLKLFDIIYNLVKHADKKGVVIVLSYVLNNKNMGQLQNINYDEIVNIPENTRNDIVWYLWKLLLSIIDHRHKSNPFVKESVNLIFEIFLAIYQKKHRLNRINMLIYSFVLLCGDDFKVSDKSVESKIIMEAINKIHIVYRETLKPDDDLIESQFAGSLAYLDPVNCTPASEQPHVEPTVPVAAPPVQQVTVPAEKQPQSNNEKLDYLNRMIYLED